MKLSPLYGQKLSVLITDDEPEIREMLSSFLRMMECFSFIVTASDGQDAFMKYQNQRFDLVITDLIMPRASGLDFIKNILRIEKDKNKRAPILILSANLTSEEVQNALSLGIKYLLTKPCSAKDFIDKVTNILLKEKKDKVKAVES